jgi:glycosyltransferase involved in cell wall biosynthesis
MKSCAGKLDVSVVLCTHNGSRFVAEQVRSILAQRPAPRQLVVGDDASNDDTVAIIERTVAAMNAETPELDIELIVLRRQVALGVSANFEGTMARARGPLIALSDQDDVWPIGRLARLVPLFNDPTVQLVHTDASLVDAEGEATGESLLGALEVSSQERFSLVAGNAWSILLRRNLVTGATVVLRREFGHRAMPFPTAWLHDEWLAMLAAAEGGVRLVDEPLLNYRQHGENEIGASTPTWGRRWRRLSEPRSHRAARLVARSEALVMRLEHLNADPQLRQQAAEKARFERSRAEAPRWQLLRIPGVLVRLVRGEYARFARGIIDVIRDLVQPAGD